MTRSFNSSTSISDSHALLIGIPGSGRRSVSRLVGGLLHFNVIDLSSLDVDEGTTHNALRTAIRHGALCGGTTAAVEPSRGPYHNNIDDIFYRGYIALP